MFGAPLSFTCQKMNDYLHANMSLDEDMVLLSPVIDAEGRKVPEVKNRAALFVANMVEDTTNRSFAHRSPGAKAPVPQYFDIHFVIATIFDPALYHDGLSVLGLIATFFQSNPIFLADKEPSLPAPLKQLSYDVIHLST